MPRVEIIRVTPLPGLGIAKDQVPSNVQTLNDRKLKQMQSLNLPDALATQMPSVTVNEIQGNPYQLDVNYRGSPPARCSARHKACRCSWMACASTSRLATPSTGT